MTRRRGFTLIEVMVALVITGLIGLAAYAALDAGLMTRDRLDGTLREREASLIARGLLDNALRHLVDRGGDHELAVRSGGSAGDDLLFDTRGVEEPYGGSGLWRMAVQGATLSARPLESPGAVLKTTIPGVIGIHVSTLDADGWHDGSGAMPRSPTAVRIEFIAQSGQAPVPSLVVELQPLMAR